MQKKLALIVVTLDENVTIEHINRLMGAENVKFMQTKPFEGSVTNNDINKLVSQLNVNGLTFDPTVISKAHNYLSVCSDSGAIQMIELIKNADPNSFIDFIDGVEVVQDYENVFTAEKFLKVLGINK